MSRYFWGGFFAGTMDVLWLIVWPIPKFRRSVREARDWYLNEFPNIGREFRLEVGISERAQTCWRCITLGLPRNGIAPDERHILIYDGDRVIDRACMDCFARMAEELEPEDHEFT